MKKFNLNFDPKFNINIKIVILGISTSIFIYLLYLSIPSLYKSGRVQKVLSDEILSEFNLNVSLSPDITYRILPKPHFSIKNSKLFYFNSNINNEIGELKELKIFINQSNFFQKDKIIINKILIKEANFFLKKKSLVFLKELVNKKFSDQKVQIKNSKLFFNDKNDNTVFIYSIDNLIAEYARDGGKNLINMDGEIFKIPVKLYWEKDLIRKHKIFKANLKKINLDILNKSIFDKEKYLYQNEISILSSKFKTNYEITKKKINFNSEQSMIRNTPIKYSGKIDLKPLFIYADVESKTFDLYFILKNSFWFNEIIKAGFIFNENFNGKISIKSDKIIKNKLFEKISFIVNVNEGNLDFNETLLINDKIGNLKIQGSSFFEKDDKVFLEAKAILDIKELESFYKKLLIPKNKRKNLKKLEFYFEFDTINTNFKVTKINFYSSNNKKINSEKIDDLVDDYADRRFEYLNSNGFKNFLKEIINAYFELG